MAALQIDHFDRVRDRLAELDADVMAAMQPFHAPFDAYHAYTKPRTGWRAWSGPTSATGSPPTSTARSPPSSTPTPAPWCTRCWPTRATRRSSVERVRGGDRRRPRRSAGRLALWGRRLVGEALSQAQRVAADRDALTSLLTGTVDRPGMDLAAISRMFSRLVENHTHRMAELGLQA